MSENFFIHNYLEDFSKLVKPNKEIIKKIVDVKKIFLRIKKKKKKIIIFGNGGSAAIASHVSVDLTKNSKLFIFIETIKYFSKF
jgi:phosphoheptose isomerase